MITTVNQVSSAWFDTQWDKFQQMWIYGKILWTHQFKHLYYYMKNGCNLIGLEQRYFSLIWNTYM